jgi:hypothetical protein
LLLEFGGASLKLGRDGSSLGVLGGARLPRRQVGHGAGKVPHSLTRLDHGKKVEKTSVHNIKKYRTKY